MRYFASVSLLFLLSGALWGLDNDLIGVEKIVVEVKVRRPTEGRHRTLICEQHGCRCGCVAGGACPCHPGWEKSGDGWYFYRQRGVETHGFDSRNNVYWRKEAGKWREWKDEQPVQESTTGFRNVIIRSNVRVGRSC